MGYHYKVQEFYVQKEKETLNKLALMKTTVN